MKHCAVPLVMHWKAGHVLGFGSDLNMGSGVPRTPVPNHAFEVPDSPATHTFLTPGKDRCTGSRGGTPTTSRLRATAQ